jgi:hypothetical protein
MDEHAPPQSPTVRGWTRDQRAQWMERMSTPRAGYAAHGAAGAPPRRATDAVRRRENFLVECGYQQQREKYDPRFAMKGMSTGFVGFTTEAAPDHEQICRHLRHCFKTGSKIPERFVSVAAERTRPRGLGQHSPLYELTPRMARSSQGGAGPAGGTRAGGVDADESGTAPPSIASALKLK